MTLERDIQRSIMLETCELVDWMRNNTGVADYKGVKVRYGLGGNGGADLIGIQRSSGRFVACEVKQPGKKPTAAQQVFLERVKRSGGLAFVATSVEDVKEVVG